jgi:hypothetical protein
MKNLYELLRPNIQTTLEINALKYDSAKRLSYKLMASNIWSELTVSDVSDLCSYSDLYTYQLTAHDVMYGDKFLNKDE